ncbi:hypothetical protein AB4Y32_36905 [Paraburkholderia phymatum]|uniref:Uncharacterized protein n=1 Tax=Paraburkholderia phymatum TaxID=148447 RepID=A0ACC6UCH4_9BURK
MTDTAVTDPAEDALYESIRLLLFCADLPAQRLESDIDDIGRFTAPDDCSSQLRLIEAMPPLTPAAEAIVRAMIRAYGNELFGRGSANSALCAMIKAGPVKFGQTALTTLGPDAPVPERVRPLVAEINRIFERYPESGFSHARYSLSAIGLPVGRDRLPQGLAQFASHPEQPRTARLAQVSKVSARRRVPASVSRERKPARFAERKERASRSIAPDR